MKTSQLVFAVCVCCAVSYFKTSSAAMTSDPGTSQGSTNAAMTTVSTGATNPPTTATTNAPTNSPKTSSSPYSPTPSPPASPTSTTGNSSATAMSSQTPPIQTTQPNAGSVVTWSKWGVLLLVAVVLV